MQVSDDSIAREFLNHGFRINYHSTAITRLGHPAVPGLEVRVGTVWVVGERDGEVIYHSHRDAFEIDDALARVGVR